VVALAVVPVLAALAIYGVRRYLQKAKTAEASLTVRAIAEKAKAAYERPQADGSHRLCGSATGSVPAVAPRGRKYVSSPADWDADAPSNQGFSCLGFRLSTPQYYRYSYSATPTSFQVVGSGDLDGDGVLSQFSIRGRVVGDRVELDPLEMTNEFE
jgi:type IV pilus assembly protein PilA